MCRIARTSEESNFDEGLTQSAYHCKVAWRYWPRAATHDAIDGRSQARIAFRPRPLAHGALARPQNKQRYHCRFVQRQDKLSSKESTRQE